MARLPPHTRRDRRRGRGAPLAGARRRGDGVWLFDLDDTLHHASGGSFAAIGSAMNDYMVRHLGLDIDAAKALRDRYWRAYGATLMGLIRHHDIDAAHFLAEAHALPGLEALLRAARPDLAWLRRLPGRKVLLTNAPQRYAQRVLEALGIAPCFERVLSVEHMRMFGHYRPKPDARMYAHVCAQLRLAPSRCTLVEDSAPNLKTAHALGMRTVWMRGWMPTRTRRRPAYVDRRVSRLRDLRL
ncbi:pyrimidine 5'-nucleotidase [Roseateles aquatilis]|uniref:pyrimidine 5'-nucleotidase n=1 Tax=Roseateles aquatilis TaxID=431061 RepID=UPI001EDFC163|nr:pyrimidine 5'-nucleotidase [Roseateles aquatilis]